MAGHIFLIASDFTFLKANTQESSLAWLHYQDLSSCFLFLFLYNFISILEPGSHYVVQAIHPQTHSPLPPRCWNYRKIITHPLFTFSTELTVLNEVLAFLLVSESQPKLFPASWSLSLDCSSLFLESPPPTCPSNSDLGITSPTRCPNLPLGSGVSCSYIVHHLLALSVVAFSFSFPPSPVGPGASPVANTMTTQSNWPINVSLV